MQNTVLRGIFVGINGLIFLGTIILNILAIVYILSTRDKTTIAILVVNLAIADIIHASKFKKDEKIYSRFFYSSLF
jgi:anti-anti-sigma regulatory factor